MSDVTRLLAAAAGNRHAAADRFNPKTLPQGLNVIREMKTLKTIGVDEEKA